MAPSAIDNPSPSQQEFVDPNELRTTFSLAMSAMYKKEVPLYGDLIKIVQSVNEEALRNSADPKITAMRNGNLASERLDLERHGAIRLGTPHELQTVRRIFAIIGLYPVGYYDLSPAGLPMHATCFRPTTTAALSRNPFRVFTTLLRPDLLKDAQSKDLALDLLSQRSIFSPELVRLLDAAERQNHRLRPDEASAFVRESMKTFGWRPIAAASKDVYQKLKDEHPILADVACFQSAHINHLTPRTLDIAAAQERMRIEGLRVKERIEGPPPRKCPVLLRQTSFLALEESTHFPSDRGLEEGCHKARFGEIEERGAAVTDRGRALYDELLNETMRQISACPRYLDASQKDKILVDTFARFPDNWDDLRRQGLVYFDYSLGASAKEATIPLNPSVDDLISRGVLVAVPITYEDFLPMSAAGIFQSNLGNDTTAKNDTITSFSDHFGFQQNLGCAVTDLDTAYAMAQDASLRKCALELGMVEDALL
ncbi:uncharacterized protein N0V89_010303 [Didymosphaeria variabile]|uniref:2-oxoadipate dioxygenase/decarboxylase n=1 Tax=Didymosphaeria variabile TaxID=1932322 RepID=A0A9W8XB16_9PLEO|nr:uncharacterized protein N0V89_010303 [Didymosphaeria variabile]KAJ4346374.1 hypothetical protein N0V89_010303 [Didymosphaeria variabile]